MHSASWGSSVVWDIWTISRPILGELPRTPLPRRSVNKVGDVSSCHYVDMAQSDSRRIRFLFRTGNVNRQFCWFEQRGDNLYWGPSRGKPIRGAVATSDERGMTISVPDEIEMVDNQPLKASFHASGQFHIKEGDALTGAPEHWRLKNEIKAPYRIAALLSKHPILYDPYPSGRSLTRRRTNAQVIAVNHEAETTRFYFEFFVSPEGRFSLPSPILSLTPSDDTEPMSFSLSEQLILVTRIFVLSPGSELSTWHPELGLWIHGSDESNTPTGA
jgi:hypothetical protein